jgi:hypothetical protein
MNAGTSIQDLEQRIEALVREHIATSRSAAAAAVVRAFAETADTPEASRARTSSATKPRQPARRRSAGEIAELAERLCAAVHETPGATMTTLAPRVGATAQKLSVAAGRLRRAGRVRTVGQRQHTKYFPAAPSAAV